MPLSFLAPLEAAVPSTQEGGAAALLAGVLDSAMDAIITVDEAQTILLYNRAAEAVFGWPRDAIVGQPLDRLIPLRFQGAHREHLRRFGETGATSRATGARSMVRGIRANGIEFPLDASISQLSTPHGKLFTVVLRDNTQREQGEELRERLAARLAGMLDSAMDAIITVDESHRIVLYNRAAEKLFGWPSAQAMGKPLAMLLPERFRAGHDAHMKRFASTGVTSRRMGDGTVLFGLRASGEEFPMDASISQIATPDGKLLTAILRDVTERVRAQQERSAFAAAANAIREEEKARVARELHDELAQALTAIKMDADWVRDKLVSEPGEAQRKLQEMIGLIDGAVASTRRIASDLRPLLLDDLGLGPAIEWLAGSFSQRHRVRCELSVDEELELEEPYATAVFRIVQESLANVAKHAGASVVSVEVERAGGEIVLSVRDDGRGFDPQGPRAASSLGLMGLHERTRLLDGAIEITSAPGKGTCIQVRIPVRKPAEPAP